MPSQLIKWFSLVFALVLTGCANNPNYYASGSLTTAEMDTVAASFATRIQRDFGANAIFEFNYSKIGASVLFSEAIDRAFRRTGLGISTPDKTNQKYTELAYTFDQIAPNQFYLLVRVGDDYSLQQIWLRDDVGLIRVLPTIAHFDGRVANVK
ncbi:MAG: hypothetical protein R3Y10_07080 [Ferrimonas sp.]